jgi:BolA protein
VSAERFRQVETLLLEALQPASLKLKDQSHLHAGHAGAEDGKSHFAVAIISEHFAGLSRIQRHRLVFNALGQLMETDIHALKIRAQTPQEANGL